MRNDTDRLTLQQQNARDRRNSVGCRQELAAEGTTLTTPLGRVTGQGGSRILPPPALVWLLYAALFTFAHRARCAAAIRFRPAAEIVRFGFGA